MKDVFLFHKNLTKLSFGAFPSFPERLTKMIPLFEEKQVQTNTVIVIHLAASTQNALFWNERKVKEG